MDHVAGYCIVNDVSERDFQFHGGGNQWIKGKSPDTFAPVGPWLVTKDEVPDPQNLALWLEVDGHRYQDGSTRTMIFDVAHLVSHCSRYMTLLPGRHHLDRHPARRRRRGQAEPGVPQGRQRHAPRHRGPGRAAPGGRPGLRPGRRPPRGAAGARDRAAAPAAAHPRRPRGEPRDGPRSRGPALHLRPRAPGSRGAAQALIRRIESGWPPQGGIWVVEWRDRPGFLGWCGVIPLEDSGLIELGYRYVRAAWGRGVATEAAQAVLDHGFRVLAHRSDRRRRPSREPGLAARAREARLPLRRPAPSTTAPTSRSIP